MFSEIFKNFLIHSFCSAKISDSENALFTFLRLITVKSKTNLEKQKLTLDNWGYQLKCYKKKYRHCKFCDYTIFIEV